MKICLTVIREINLALYYNDSFKYAVATQTCRFCNLKHPYGPRRVF